MSWTNFNLSFQSPKRKLQTYVTQGKIIKGVLAATINKLCALYCPREIRAELVHGGPQQSSPIVDLDQSCSTSSCGLNMHEEAGGPPPPLDSTHQDCHRAHRRWQDGQPRTTTVFSCPRPWELTKLSLFLKSSKTRTTSKTLTKPNPFPRVDLGYVSTTYLSVGKILSVKIPMSTPQTMALTY